MDELHITSPANPRLKALAGLRRRRTLEQEGRTLIEGYDELGLALDAGVVPHALFYCPDLMGEEALPKTAGYPSTIKAYPVLSYVMKDIDGKKVNLARYQGSVIMMVNVASKCGNTSNAVIHR